MIHIPTPEVQVMPVVTCPVCHHGIDPHGLEPGGFCGVGMYDPDEGNQLCECLWSPNNIAAYRLQALEERLLVDAPP